ncbi:MAG: hypothetical protein AB7O26_15335 [Planctomycetaceae bacterium]
MKLHRIHAALGSRAHHLGCARYTPLMIIADLGDNQNAFVGIEAADSHNGP